VNKPTHWIVPARLMPFFDTAARNNTLVNQTVGYAEDDFGRRIIKFKGLPILFGYEPDDSPDLLPFTEVAAGGGGAVTGSIYCVSFRRRRLLRHRADAAVGDAGRPDRRPAVRLHAHQMGLGHRARTPAALARLTSITNAAIVA
jgi:hypothetical protein